MNGVLLGTFESGTITIPGGNNSPVAIFGETVTSELTGDTSYNIGDTLTIEITTKAVSETDSDGAIV